MSEIEVINWLKSQNKPYQGIMPQATFSSCIIRYEAGLLKPKTLISFFEKMGFININASWEKK